jgi:hypothetical protein
VPDPARTPRPAAGGSGPKVRWQSSARLTLVAVVGVTVLGFLAFYLLFLSG